MSEENKEILGPPVGFTDLLDYEITEKLKAAEEERKSGNIKYHPLRPSSAGHCSRKLALELSEFRGKTYYGRPILEPHIDRLFSLGHSVEYSALRNFEVIKMFEQKYKQQALTLFQINRGPGLESDLIEGSCDSVLYSKQYRCILDVKSKKDGWSSYFKSKWEEEFEKLSSMESTQTISPTAIYADDLEAFISELGNDYLIDNLLQLNLYACSQFMKERGVSFAFLYRYNKNSSEHMEVRFRPSERVFKHVQEKFQKISDIVDQGKAEELVCDFPIGSMRYAFCDCHKMLPYSDKDPVKTFFQSLPKKVWPKDVAQIADSKALIENYQAFSKAKKEADKAKKFEEEIIKFLTKLKVSKVRFDDGAVYEVKLLKSPKEHFELRRSK